MNFNEQIAIVLTLWHQKEDFPIDHQALPGFTDDTQSSKEGLCKVSPQVRDVFFALEKGGTCHLEITLQT